MSRETGVRFPEGENVNSIFFGILNARGLF